MVPARTRYARLAGTPELLAARDGSGRLLGPQQRDVAHAIARKKAVHALVQHATPAFGGVAQQQGILRAVTKPQWK